MLGGHVFISGGESHSSNSHHGIGGNGEIALD
jgi:hypothetical protein